MKILVACDSFKETLSAKRIGEIIGELFKEDSVSILPLSDGGEGLLEAIGQEAFMTTCSSFDGLLREKVCSYELKKDLAIIESAESNGLGLLSQDEKNPLYTSTYGIGLMIKDAVSKGAKKILIGIGGSCTNDAGIGMLEALGVKFYDQNQALSMLKGEDLIKIHAIDTRDFKKNYGHVTIEVACDVDNPLLGPHGATSVYGPQKGGNESELSFLEEGMTSFSSLVKDVLKVDNKDVPGVGAAGGLGYAFKSFFNGQLKKGIDLVLDYHHFNAQVKKHDLIITGEGKIDEQSYRGKVIQGVLKRCQKEEKTLIAVSGICEEKGPIEHVFSVVPKHCSVDESMKKPEECFRAMCLNELKPWIEKRKNGI